MSLKTRNRRAPNARKGLLRASRKAMLTTPGVVPVSLDEATRSVEFTASTEAAAQVFDWERMDVVREVLLMSGCVIPPSGQVPFLNTHSAESVSDIIGSFREMRIETGGDGACLVGRAFYSATEDGEKPYVKTKEGHVTDVSVGYEIFEHMWVEREQSVEIEGQIFTGPLRVVTSWAPHEVSLCAIGADNKAKVRQKTTGKAKEQGMAKVGKRLKRAFKTVFGKRVRMAELIDENGQPKEDVLENLDAAGVESLLDELYEERARMESGEEGTLGLTEGDIDELVELLDEILVESEGERSEESGKGDGGQEDEDEDDEAKRGKKSDGAADTPKDDEKEKGERSRPRQGSSMNQPYSVAARRAERGRIQAIRGLCREFAMPEDFENSLISRGITLSRAKGMVLEKLKGEEEGMTFNAISVGTGEQAKVRAAALDGLLLRCGVSVGKPADGSMEFRGFRMMDMCRELLVRRGERNMAVDSRLLVRNALTTTDLPILLTEAVKRVMMASFEDAPETWNIWCDDSGHASDFRPQKVVNVGMDLSFDKIPEDGEYTTGLMDERGETCSIATYGKKIAISRQAIINDDLNVFTGLPRGFGLAAARKIGDLAYGELTKNGTMGDGVPLFDAKHLNLHTGAGSVPTVESLGRVVTQMKLQKDIAGNDITVIPEYFLAPIGMETACQQFFNTQVYSAPVVGTGEQPFIHNPYGGKAFTHVFERRLDAADPKSWYLAGRKGQTVQIFWLNGTKEPFVESEVDFNTDGLVIKGRIDAGAKAVAWQGLAKATE